jgi:glycosyltransferase involved in cell wall biosynthesis
MKKTIVVQSPFETVSGYGAKSRDIIRSLTKWADKNNFDVKLVPTAWGGCPRTALNNCEDRELFISRILKGPLSHQPEIFAQISIPNESQPHGKYNIIFTSGIETTLCRGEWIDGLNKMDLAIVPSNHAKAVFRAAKFKRRDPKTGIETPVEANKPIEVLFEGSDTSVYKKTDILSGKISKMLDSIPEEFCFLFVGHWLQGELGADRKDVGMMVKTFLETFKNRKDAPGLILKTSGANFSEMDKNEILRKIKRCEETTDANILPKIYFVHGELTDDEVNSLYNHKKVKVHVSFTHGEGYGRPLQEASLSGKPVIASNWSGHVDFLDDSFAVLLPGELRDVHPSAVNEWVIKESKWFVANYSSASKELKNVFENYDYYLEKADKLRKKNEKEKSLEAMDKSLEEILDRNLPKFQETVQVNLPKLNKVGGQPSGLSQLGPQLNLPKLKRVEK